MTRNVSLSRRDLYNIGWVLVKVPVAIVGLILLLSVGHWLASAPPSQTVPALLVLAIVAPIGVGVTLIENNKDRP